MANLMPLPKMRFTNQGRPLIGGKVFFYVAGTSTPKNTFKDRIQSTLNSNPVILDSNGEADIWLEVGYYKVVLRSSTDVLIWTVDGIAADAQGLNINDLNAAISASQAAAGESEQSAIAAELSASRVDLGALDQAVADAQAAAAIAASAVSGSVNTFFAATKAAADALAAGLGDGATVIADRDETRGGVRTRYSVASGLPVSPVTMELDYPTRAVLIASSLSYSDVPAGVRIRTKNENFVYEVAASGASDNHEVTAGGLKLYWIPQFIASPENGRATVALDVKHFSKQGSSPVTSPVMIAGHDYTDASRAMQIDKVGGLIAQASYVVGLRRGSNHILRDDKDGTYVAGCGFMRCSYDTFTESASFTGEISGNVLTVTAMLSGSITAGAFILWSGTDNGTTIVSQASGTTGQEGTYTVALRGTTGGSQTVASQAMTAKTKSEVLAFFIGATGDIGWSVDRAQFSTGYSGGLYAYTFNAANQTGPIATFTSSSGSVLNVLDNISGTRTDVVAPANQTSGLRLEATAGPIDIAPASGQPITVRGNINSQSGLNLTLTAVGARLDLNGSTGVRSLAPFRPGQYNVSGLPAANDYLGHIAFVTNGDSGSPCIAVSNGTDWLRIPLGAAVSA